MFQGVYCQICKIRFHQRCGDRANNMLCDPLHMASRTTIMQHMLSTNVERYHIKDGAKFGLFFPERSVSSIGSISSKQSSPGFAIRRPVPPPLPPMPPTKQPPITSSNHLSAEPPMCQRERSTSAPNVSFNLVSLNGVTEAAVQNMLGGPMSSTFYDHNGVAIDAFGEYFL